MESIIVAPAIVFPSTVGHVLGWESEAMGTVTFIIMVAVIAILYSSVLPDFSAIAVCTGFIVLFLMVLGGRVLNEIIGFEATANLLTSLALLVLWCAALTTATVKILNGLRLRMPTGGDDA